MKAGGQPGESKSERVRLDVHSPKAVWGCEMEEAMVRSLKDDVEQNQLCGENEGGGED